MGSMHHVWALATAFEIGLIDCMISRGPAPSDVLAERMGADPSGMRLLLDILAESGVLEDHHGPYALGMPFVQALRYRGLMELKLSLAKIAARDFLDGFSDMVMHPEKFMGSARFHRLFAYEKGFGGADADRRATEGWMRITTTLTRYESSVCIDHHDFSRYRSMLDVGGNSGEFALRVCRHHKGLRATVFDLPLVCDIGMDHVGGEPEAGRISFLKGDAFSDDFPAGYDLVTFKSMLHDWPDDAVNKLLEKAAGALNPGGTLLIFERAPILMGREMGNCAILPFLIFNHSYRSPDKYKGFIEILGFSDIEVRMIDLEMPFMLVTGRV